MMLIPTKIIFKGDIDRCKSVLGIARSRLVLLHDRLKRSNGMLQQGWQRPITLITGETIRLAVSFNTSIIEILAESRAGAQPQEVQAPTQKCFCDCNISLAIIISIADEMKHGLQWMSLIACNNKTSYVGYENIIASDFTRYEPGQKVIVIAYNGFVYNCASISNTSGVTGCAPQVSVYQPNVPAWLTTYRVIPLCGLLIPKWI